MFSPLAAQRTRNGGRQHVQGALRKEQPGIPGQRRDTIPQEETAISGVNCPPLIPHPAESHAMPRPTLKLPKKPAATGRDPRAAVRKPIRGGAPNARQAGRGRTVVPAEPSAAPMPETIDAPRCDDDSRTAGRREKSAAPPAPSRSKANGDLPAEAAPDASGAHARTGTSCEPACPEPSVKPAKLHPPRGVARSTGARASLPAPRTQTSPLAARARGDLATETPSAEQVAASTPGNAVAVTRGLAKESPRLAKLVSELAACSRRQADEWIENGWVSVDGEVVARLGARVNPQATIRIKDAAIRHHSESVTVLYNKPHAAGPVPQEDDRSGVAQLIRPDNHWTEDSSRRRFQSSHLRRLAPAGRLDADEAGMLVFTHEGSVARRVTGGDAKLEKEYHVRIEGKLPADALERLRYGLSLDGVKLRPAQVSWLGTQLLRFVLHESRKQQIQRMCELVGTKAATIKRVRIGSVSLGQLPSGQWRYLRPDERF